MHLLKYSRGDSATETATERAVIPSLSPIYVRYSEFDEGSPVDRGHTVQIAEHVELARAKAVRVAERHVQEHCRKVVTVSASDPKRASPLLSC
jgi:hypothetical protein